MSAPAFPQQGSRDPAAVVSAFALSGSLRSVEPFGSGLINDTYLCLASDNGRDRKYILQRINNAVFPEPEKVMANVEVVTAHIADRLRKEGVVDPALVTPTLVRARDGRSFVRIGQGEVWRMMPFIEAGEVFDRVRDRDHAYEVGRGLGRFQALCADLPADRLFETLPGFHRTPLSLAAYDGALRQDALGRAGGTEAEQRFIASRRALAAGLTDLLDRKALPIRVVHNDPKVNNVMVDRSTGRALCMLDLDTVMPGTVLFDFGDCVRSVANPLGEDASDPASVRIDIDLFAAVLDGYLQEAELFLTGPEIDSLVLSVKVITFELGLRFLADHLAGDTYFRTSASGHNLHRARVQFRLLESVENAENDLAAVVARLRSSR